MIFHNSVIQDVKTLYSQSALLKMETQIKDLKSNSSMSKAHLD
jgi:hypothetical protein